MAQRVLIEEDEANIVESLTFLLERAGFAVAVETDGRQALDTALADPPDVLVLDVMLPELDGYEILRRLRAAPKAETLPVLIKLLQDPDVELVAAAKAAIDKINNAKK